MRRIGVKGRLKLIKKVDIIGILLLIVGVYLFASPPLWLMKIQLFSDKYEYILGAVIAFVMLGLFFISIGYGKGIEDNNYKD